MLCESDKMTLVEIQIEQVRTLHSLMIVSLTTYYYYSRCLGHHWF